MAFYHKGTKSISFILTDFFWISFTSTLTTCYTVLWWSSKADGCCLWKKSIQAARPWNKHTSGTDVSWSSSNVMGKTSPPSTINIFFVHTICTSGIMLLLGHLFHIWALCVIFYCTKHAHVQLNVCILFKLLSSAIQSVIGNRQLACL